MEIKNVGIEAVRPYKKNAKKHDEAQINAVMNSIKTYGFQQPIVVDRNGVIVIGHCRYEAAKRLGLATVPAVVKDDLSDDEIKALRIVDNKTNESEWIDNLLSAEIKGLPDVDFTDFGFGDYEIMNLVDDEDDFFPEPINSPVGGGYSTVTGNGRSATPYPPSDRESGGDEYPEYEVVNAPAPPVEEVKRYIFIAHGNDEVEWFRGRLGLKGDLLMAYRVQELMEEQSNDNN